MSTPHLVDQKEIDMQRIIVWVGMLGCILSASCRSEEKQNTMENTEGYHLFLLIGQSNMAGRGVVAEADQSVHPNIMTLNREDQWVSAVDPIHFDKPIAGVGPGRSFALAVSANNPSITIGLIPGAVGGSPISSWEPGALDEATHTHPYDDALRRAKKAMEAGTLKAILWHQGESDSNEALAPEYKEHLIRLIRRLREEFGDAELPFFIGQLGNFSEKPWDQWQSQVNEAHLEVAQEIGGVHFVSSEGLGHKGDTLHFSAAAERELGRRYAQRYIAQVK